MQEDGIRLNHVLAAQLLSCYGAAGNSQQAERVMEELGRGQSPPNLTHWNALVYSHAEARHWEACKGAYLRLLEAGQRPNSYTLVALLRGLMHAACDAAAAEPAEERTAFQQQGGEGRGGCAGTCSLDAEVSWVHQEMQRYHIPMTSHLGTAFIAYWLGEAKRWRPLQLTAWHQASKRKRAQKLRLSQQAQQLADEAAGNDGHQGQQSLQNSAALDQFKESGVEGRSVLMAQVNEGLEGFATTGRRQQALRVCEVVWGRLLAAGQGEAAAGAARPSRVAGRKQRGSRAGVPSGGSAEVGAAGGAGAAPDVHAFNCMMEMQLVAGQYGEALQVRWMGGRPHHQPRSCCSREHHDHSLAVARCTHT